MNVPVQKRAMTRLRVRSKLKNVSLIYAIALRKLANELTGRGNLEALFAWCRAQGVGVDGFSLTHIPGGSQGEAWLDARRQRGIFVDRVGNLVATLVDGRVKGDASYAAWLAVLPSTEPVEWGEAQPAAAAKKAKAPRASKRRG